MTARKAVAGVVIPFLVLSARAASAVPGAPEPVSSGSLVRQETVAHGCPKFSWRSVPGARSHWLEIYEVGAPPSIAPPDPRRRGRRATASARLPVRVATLAALAVYPDLIFG